MTHRRWLIVMLITLGISPAVQAQTAGARHRAVDGDPTANVTSLFTGVRWVMKAGSVVVR